MKINYPLLALAIGAFGIGTTEFSPMGLLPVIARGVDVSIPAAGMLISAYAVGVMVGAPLMTLLLSHRARRGALIFLMAIFTLGNVLSAIAPDYMTLMLSRILTSLNHGAFFGLGSVVAASVVPKHKQASAVATMFMGLTPQISVAFRQRPVGRNHRLADVISGNGGAGRDFNGKSVLLIT